MKELSEHEKLKAICDEIGYEVINNSYIKYKKWDIPTWVQDWYFDTFRSDHEDILINVREIIFTQDFMDKYKKYFLTKSIFSYMRLGKREDVFDVIIAEMIAFHLNAPVDYLYETLNLWK